MSGNTKRGSGVLLCMARSCVDEASGIAARAGARAGSPSNCGSGHAAGGSRRGCLCSVPCSGARELELEEELLPVTNCLDRRILFSTFYLIFIKIYSTHSVYFRFEYRKGVAITELRARLRAKAPLPIGWPPSSLLRYSDGGAWTDRTLQCSVAAPADVRLQTRVLRTLVRPVHGHAGTLAVPMELGASLPGLHGRALQARCRQRVAAAMSRMQKRRPAGRGDGQQSLFPPPHGDHNGSMPSPPRPPVHPACSAMAYTGTSPSRRQRRCI